MANRSVEHRVSEVIRQFKPVQTTQDAVDQSAAELYTADLLRKHADARYDAAKRNIMEAHAERVDIVRGMATTQMRKYTEYTEGEDWQLEFTANTPSKRVNVDELRTALIRRGVKVDVIDACIKEVEKLSSPATIIKASALTKSTKVA